jgi:transcriptional regulator with XRE-family HTH domain
MTLDQYRIKCGWTQSELARQARVDVATVRKALAGENVAANTANKLAEAFSRRLGYTIISTEIEGLNFNL